MALAVNEPDVKADVVTALQELANQGASVRDLVRCVQSRLGLKPDALLQVLWYFMNAFHLPLGDVLPIREWLGSDQDQEIDSIILPAIRRTRGEWAAESR